MGALKERCVIIGGGECSVDLLNKNIDIAKDYIICADSGYDIAKAAGIEPDLLIGDFDSINEIPEDVITVQLPVEKDVTDCAAAFYEASARDYREILLLGGTGGRFEHTFANLALLARAVKFGFDFTMIDSKHKITGITDSSVKISFSKNRQISIFAFGEKAEGVTLKGFHYPLNNYTLDPFVPLGISNDIVADYGEISVNHGTLIIIETQM